jgi:hypothetical protein
MAAYSGQQEITANGKDIHHEQLDHHLAWSSPCSYIHSEGVRYPSKQGHEMSDLP